ncbi:hypothetical protein MFLAVUS_001403 [Mucor flavus]|uniref:Uncharacterized protein n=1 Tax=Mucor flavus TaxID=439312 RepID=A0ABP9YMG0_9FUNG
MSGRTPMRQNTERRTMPAPLPPHLKSTDMQSPLNRSSTIPVQSSYHSLDIDIPEPPQTEAGRWTFHSQKEFPAPPLFEKKLKRYPTGAETGCSVPIDLSHLQHVLMWDENKVTKWMTTVGFASFEKQFREQGITGDVLVNLDHESLRDLSILTVGQRMDLLKSIYQLKIQHRVPVNEWDYIPPSVLYETDWLGQNGMADYRKIEAAFQERDARIKRLTEDLIKVNSDMNSLREEISHIIKAKPPPKVFHKQHINSPTKIASLHSNDHEEAKLTPNVMINDGGAIKVYGEKIEHEPESSKNVRLLLDDPTSKVICSALKKYNVVSDWQQYALWIQYGPHDNMQERALGYDERPLRISQKLKDAKQNPVFVLKHVKDNKPFIPPTNYSHPRPAPPKPQQITSGKVGFEVVIPVMSSSMSSPTTSTSSKRQVKKTNEYNNELGLDSAVVNAIFSINNGSQNP